MAEEMVAVVGGSGLYTFLTDAQSLVVETPYGAHSEGLTLGLVAGREVAFLPRHGIGHQLPAHVINYRANMWALASLGVKQVLAPCAVGSLQPHLVPGTFVIPDQLVDRTRTREPSYVDSGMFHVGFADPYCSAGRDALSVAAGHQGISTRSDGTMVVIEGPRFSTRAESQSLSRQGWSVVNMTGMPEAVLARELEMCYSTLALVTDFDAGVDATTSVTQAEAIAVFTRNLESMCEVLNVAVSALPRERTCQCVDALQGMSTQHLPPVTSSSPPR